MRKTRIAVAGAGYIGLAHMGVLRASATCELSAVVDPSPAAQVRAQAAGVPLYKSLAELFAKSRPDGVVLATPNQLHVPQALECINVGCRCCWKSRLRRRWPRRSNWSLRPTGPGPRC